MPKYAQPLADTDLRNARAKAKPYTLSDGGGLSLLVKTNGARLWVVRYQLHGKPGQFGAGPYPDIGLAQARDIAARVRQDVRDGRNPVAARQTARKEAAEAAGQTFKRLAERWIERQTGRWAPGYKAQIESTLAREVLPHIGKAPIASITTRGLAAWFEPLSARSPTTARIVRQNIHAIFEHAATVGLLGDQINPAARLAGLVENITTTPRPAAADLDTARAVLAAVEAEATPVLALAHRWLVLTAARTSEALGARWCEITGLDGESPVWVLPKGRMKARRLHAVPLAPAAVDVLRAVRALDLPGDLIFSLKDGKRISRSTMLECYKRADLPVKHVPHGWRSTFSTLMNERYPADRAQIDLMLAHAAGSRSAGDVSAVESTYNRATHLARRRELAGVWAGLILHGASTAAELIGMTLSAAPKLRAA